MRRKVVKQGTATLMVSLPAAWARRNAIEKGTEVEVQEFKDSIRILPTSEATSSHIEIDTTGLGSELLKTLAKIEADPQAATYKDPKTYKQFQQSMLRLLAALYKSGYDEIKVLYDHPGTINLIQEALGQEMSEYEIVEQTKSYCVLQDISGVIKERFDPAVNRIFFLLMQMAEESEPIIESGEYHLLKPLRYLEESNNRFTTFCRRLLSKKGYKNPDKIQFMYHILEQLERIADQYKYLFDYLMQKTEKENKKEDRKENKEDELNEQVIALYTEMNKMLREYWEFYSGFDKKKIFKMGAQRKKLVAESMKLMETSTGKNAMLLHYIITNGQLIFELVEPTISLRL